MPFAQHRSQHRVHEAGRARLASRARQIDRIVDDRGRGDAIEVQQLIQAQLQDHEHVGIDPLHLAVCEVFDEVFDGALPAHGAGHDLDGERTVTLVLQVRTAARQRGGQVGTVAADRAQRVVRRGARRRDHGDEKRCPASSGRLARNSRVDIGRRPSA